MTAVKTRHNTMDETIIYRESYSSFFKRTKHVKRRGDNIELVECHKPLANIRQTFGQVFLPQGYPDSVSSDYLEYQIWDTVQAFASSITGTLASQALLKGVGVGDESATVMAATMTWLYKDGAGMVGRILFAWKKGTALDADCKKWRLVADILNDCAFFMEIVAPLFKSWFRIIVCMASIFKSIVGVAGGATRAALTQHQARRNNMADVAAKDGSQETLVNLGALILSLVLVPLVSGNQQVVWILFFFSTMLHLFANYRAVTAVKMEKFNLNRFHLTVQHYLMNPHEQILSVKEANKMEPILSSIKRRLKVYTGVSIETVVNNNSLHSLPLTTLVNIFRNLKYMLSLDLDEGVIYITLHEKSTPQDHLQAVFHAELLEFAVRQRGKSSAQAEHSEFYDLIQALQIDDMVALIEESTTICTQKFPNFLTNVNKHGWDINDVLLNVDEWRAVWGLGGVDFDKPKLSEINLEKKTH